MGSRIWIWINRNTNKYNNNDKDEDIEERRLCLAADAQADTCEYQRHSRVGLCGRMKHISDTMCCLTRSLKWYRSWRASHPVACP